MDPSSAVKYRGMFILCGIFLISGILRLNDLSIYTPDSSKYLIWANSLAHGKGFTDDTQPTVDRFVVNAPLYSALIAPVAYFFPGSVVAAKIWTLFLGLLAIVLFYLYLHRLAGYPAALIGAACLALNPAMLLFSTEMLSEAPFIALLLAVLLILESMETRPQGYPRISFPALVLLLAFVPLLREAGAALVLAVVLYYFLLKNYRRGAIILAASAIVSFAWYYRNQVWVGSLQGPQRGNLSLVSQHFVTSADAPLVNEILLRIWYAAQAYLGHLGEMFFYSFASPQFSDLLVNPPGILRLMQSVQNAVSIPLALLLLILMCLGVAADIRKRPTAGIRLMTTLIFLAAIFAYPVNDIRFLLPLYPLCIFYLLEGCTWCITKFSALSVLRSKSLAYLLAAVILFPNLMGIEELLRTNQAFLRSPRDLILHSNRISSLYRFDWRTMGEWIAQHTSDRTVFASPMKELAVVSGGRKVLDLDPGTGVADFEASLRNNHAEYILAVIEGDLNLYEFQMTQTRRFWFEPVCDAENLHLLRIHSVFLEPAAGNLFSPADTVSAIHLMRQGNEDLKSGLYTQALSTFTDAYERFPRHPAIVYGRMTAAYMHGDTSTGTLMYNRLLSLPQTLAYAALARQQIDAMRFLRTSSTSSQLEERAVARLKSAMIYWRLGYYRRAAEIVDTLLDTGSQYFFGLLWGTHFNLQNGDTMKANRFLSAVNTIDSTNIVGESFTRVFRLCDSLAQARTDSLRSRLLLDIARVYLLIDLNEEAIDEAEKALHAAPLNLDAAVFIGQVYERKGAVRTAEQIFRKALLQNPKDTALLAHADSLRKILER